MYGQQITQHLLSQNLIKTEDVLNEQFIIIPEKRDRFVTWKVIIKGIPCYLIKCPRNSDSKNRLKQEADSLNLLSSIPATRDLIPAIYQGKTDQHYIVMEYLYPAEPLNQYLFTEDTDSLWQLLAQALSSLHASTTGTTSVSITELPWILSVLDKNFYWKPEELDSVLALNRDVRWLKECMHLCKQNWCAECLIHGDMKLEHCMLNLENHDIYFIDWELGIHGDPAWDLAGIMNEFILNYATPESIKPGTEMFELFFQYYIKDQQDNPATIHLYERSLMFTSARLFQSCLELAAVNCPAEDIKKYLKYAHALWNHNNRGYAEHSQGTWSVAQ